MLRYTFRRFLIGLVQLLGLVITVFFLIRLLPADPVSRLVGMNASKQASAQAQAQLGLDRPVLTQMSIYLGFAPGTAPGLLQGSLGQSWVTGSAVTADIAAYLPVTIERITLSFVIAFVIAVPVGMLSALRSGGCHRSVRCRRRSPGSCWLIQCWPDNQGSFWRRRIIRCCQWPT